jgi:hypothetical protein
LKKVPLQSCRRSLCRICILHPRWNKRDLVHRAFVCFRCDSNSVAARNFLRFNRPLRYNNTSDAHKKKAQARNSRQANLRSRQSHTSPCRQSQKTLIDLLATTKDGMIEAMLRDVKEP